MAALTKSKRPKARDPKKAQDYMDGKAVESGNRAAERRAKEAAMDEKAKKPVTKKMSGGKMAKKPMKKMSGGKMDKKPMKKMASGGSCRGMGAAKKGGKYGRSG